MAFTCSVNKLVSSCNVCLFVIIDDNKLDLIVTVFWSATKCAQVTVLALAPCMVRHDKI
jgi:hypothetical protein